MKFSPKKYQVPAIEFIGTTPRCAIHAGIGSGKTVIALTAVAEMWSGLDISKVLILAPLNVILNTFPDELAKWDHLGWLTCSVLHGDFKDERLRDDSIIHLCNYEGLEWLTQHKHRQHYDVIVMDESHWIKDHRTERFKMIRDHLAGAGRMVHMSGTPIGNSLLDLWAQYYLLDGGKRLYRGYEFYRNAYFEQADYKGYKWTAYDWSMAAVIKKVEDITFQVHPDDVKLTALTEGVIPCELTAEQMTVYRQLERDYFLEIEDAEIVAFNAATLISKLRQFANGFLYYGDPDAHVRDVVRLHSVKFDKLADVLRSTDENVMVVATFTEDFQELERRFPNIKCIYGRTSKGVTRRRILAWNRGEIKELAIHPRSVGIGLNLQYGGSYQVWLSPDWSYLAKKQTIGRLHRTDQAEDVTVDVIVAQDTVDEMIMESIRDKSATAETFAEKLRLYRAAVLAGRV